VFIGVAESGILRASLKAGSSTVETLLPGTIVNCLAADPLDGERVYAGAQDLGVLRSDDGGRNWRQVGLKGRTVTALAASPRQREVVYAGVRPSALFVSADGGAHWEELLAFRRIRGRRFWFSPASRPYTAYVQGLALSPADPDRIVLGIEFGATVVSSDGGRSWSSHRRGSLRDCHGLCCHAIDGNWVYEAGGTGGGAAFSRDGGLTWTQAGEGLDQHYGWAVAADAIDPTTWYVSAAPGPSQAHGGRSAQAGIFRRDGNHWRRLGGGLPQPLAHMPYALITDPGAGGSVYAGLANGEIWHSSDRGESWRQLPVRLGTLRRVLIML
jgi:photosystem II stability/assembly factor-like uncharacterized protein